MMKTLRLFALTIVCLTAFVLCAHARMSVARHEFAAQVMGREPVETSDTFSRDVNMVYCFTHIVGAGEPQEIVHVWIYEGEVRAEVVLSAEGQSWRTWSTKTILPVQTGEWTVEIRDAEGQVLSSRSFTVVE